MIQPAVLNPNPPPQTPTRFAGRLRSKENAKELGFSGRLRFSGDDRQPAPEKLPQNEIPAELKAAAAAFKKALKDAERLPGFDSRDSVFNQLIGHLLNGDAAFGAQITKTIQVLTRGPEFKKSCQVDSYQNEKGQERVGYRIQAGTLNKLFKQRVLHSASTTTFDDLLEKKFGYNQRVILSITGWTKPPVDPFLKSDYHRKHMEKMPQKDWPKYAEQVYVNTIKDFLGRVITALKTELGDQFDPIRDLGIIYGVTPEGADRAVQEFCKDHSIPIVGATCYDWAEYIPDEGGLPDVFIAEDPGGFGAIMANTANRILITGGRGFAAGVKIDGNEADGANRRVPVDLLKSFESIEIPAVVADNDHMTAKIVNGAALAKTLGCNPWESDLVQKAINGRKIDNEDVFTATYIIKNELERLYRSKKIQTALGKDRAE